MMIEVPIDVPVRAVRKPSPGAAVASQESSHSNFKRQRGCEGLVCDEV